MLDKINTMITLPYTTFIAYFIYGFVALYKMNMSDFYLLHTAKLF